MPFNAHGAACSTDPNEENDTIVEKPDAYQNITNKEKSLFLKLLLASSIVLIPAILALYHDFSQSEPEDTVGRLFVFGIETCLLIGLAISLSWALSIYSYNMEIKDYRSDSRISSHYYSVLAHHHSKFCQVWFSIALTVFMGGLIFAVMHIAEELFHGGPEPERWLDFVLKIAPNIFAYSLFFAFWTWALRNYRRHWHNFVTNKNRASAIDFLKGVKAGVSGDERSLRANLQLLMALVVFMPTASGYVPEEHEEQTATEKLVKVEELVRDMFTKQSPP